jgi:hypothetical protein
MATAIKLVEPAQNEFLADLEKRSNRPNHFFRAMANRHEVLKHFVPLYGSILGPGSVDRRAGYCTAAHVASAGRAGVTEEEMRALQAEQDGGFIAPERAAIECAGELTRTADGAQTRYALNGHYNDERIVEITLIAALANFTNRFNNGLDLAPEQ